MNSRLQRTLILDSSLYKLDNFWSLSLLKIVSQFLLLDNTERGTRNCFIWHLSFFRIYISRTQCRSTEKVSMRRKVKSPRITHNALFWLGLMRYFFSIVFFNSFGGCRIKRQFILNISYVIKSQNDIQWLSA